MGYWGYFVVGRSERPLDGLDALVGVEGLVLRESAPDGWQVWEYASGEGEVNEVVKTTSPANVNRAWENWCRSVDRPYKE